MTILLIDAGNTRIKWARVQHGRWLSQGEAGSSSEGELALTTQAAPDAVWISNVAGAEVSAALQRVCNSWQITPHWVQAQSVGCGVSNGYDVPGQLGSDRWAALIAAWRMERRACLVVNCGTATTIDFLQDQGQFPGGLILPGLDRMKRCLLQSTALTEVPPGDLSDFPRNTADAITSGALLATAGAVRLQYARLPEASPCFLSGGAADQLIPLLEDLPLICIDNLVLRGLQIMAEEASA